LIVDSSALVAIILKEPGSDVLLEKVAGAPHVGVGAPTLAETGIVLTARAGLEARRSLPLFVMESGMKAVPFGEDHWRAAVDAFRRYGKGRHPAGLNFGDCLAYATAKLAGHPLLCTGKDFGRTDLEIA